MSRHLSKAVDRLSSGLDKRSLSERALMFAVAASAIFALANLNLLGPLAEQRSQLELTAQALAEQTNLVKASLARVQAAVTAPAPSASEQGDDSLAVLDEELARLKGRLVPPAQMSALLRQMVREQPGVTLTSLENFPVQTLGGTADKKEGQQAPEAQASAPQPVLYKHTMRITLTGRYLELVRYLQVLEEAPFSVFWQGMSLESLKPPLSELTVEVYTVSLDPAWVEV